MGACLLAALTVLVLLPSLWYVDVHLGNTDGWQVNHANHVAAGHAAMLTLASVGGGALAGLGLRRLSGQAPTAAGQALALATGALLGALALDVTAFFWMLHDGTLLSGLNGGAF